jgi:hypothetical protein
MQVQNQGEAMATKKHALTGKIVLVRDNRAGVFVGTLVAFDGPSKCATLKNARKVWQWYGSGAVEGIAARGLDQARSKVTAKVQLVELCDIVQIVACEKEGAASVMGAPEWKP